jgi:hypothetical protein
LSSYESIATVAVGSGGTASAEFTSIPSTYKHLQVRFLTRSSVSDLDAALIMQFNGDTAANYAWHLIRGSGSAVLATANFPDTNIWAGTIVGNNSTANVFGAGVIDILDYASTSKNKTTRELSGFDANGSGYVQFHSGARYNTAAISSIKLFFSGSNLMQYSHFALYGIRG